MEFHAIGTQASALVNKIVGGERDLEDLNGDSHLSPCMVPGVSRRLRRGGAGAGGEVVSLP